MDHEWHAKADIGASAIHRLIVDLAFSIIYITHFDYWLERAHEHYKKPFKKIASVRDLPQAANLPATETQIIKFHGDFEDGESLVLTESPYFARLSFESPLDIRLRADLLSRSVLFIGYSLSDINVRYMLYKLNNLWTKNGPHASRPSSFMFLTRPNPVQQRILEDRRVIPIVSANDDPGKGLEDFLEGLAKAVNHGET